MLLLVKEFAKQMSLLKGGWTPLEDSEERRRALLPRTASPQWDDLMVQPDYMQALGLIP